MSESERPVPSEELTSRLARIEHAVADLSLELAAIRRELREPPYEAPPRSAPPESERSAPPGSARRPAWGRPGVASDDLERLVGRYGMLAIAVLTAVAAVGTFLSWAISRGYLQLEPPARVAIGFAMAGALGAWGIRLRRRERSFGSSIVGLALVITHVCAYAAGPGLHIVPPLAAFVVAALISWALAMFAHGENDEPLWCVGFGGAALAPFVTSSGHGNVYLLLVYGLLILLPACFAISHREWPIGWRVFYAASALFAVSGTVFAVGESLPRFLAPVAFPLVIAVAGVIPFAPDSRKRGALRWMGALSVIATLPAHPVAADRLTLTVVFLMCSAAWLLVLDRHAHLAQSSIVAPRDDAGPVFDWVDAAVIPLAFVSQAIASYSSIGDSTLLFGAASLLFLVFTWRRGVGPLRDAGAFGVVAAVAALVAALPLETPTGRIAGFAALGLLLLLAFREKPSFTWLVSTVVILLGTTGTVAVLLWQRPAYTFTPFATEPSLCAVAMVVSLVIVARSWPLIRSATRQAMAGRPEWSYAESLRSELRAFVLAPVIWAFIWIFSELSMAFSPSASTLLLVAYFAAAGVASVAVGRARRSSRVRQTGLALAIAAAVTAFYGASRYFDFGARIAAYLVTSAFLLGIAYWYRRPGGEPGVARPA